jgi:very-short-patch-repair endonuclease
MRVRSRLSRHQRAVIESHACVVRHAPTRSEAILFSALSGKKLGVVFRRQVRVGRFIADLAAPEVRLIVEVDGASHGCRREADERRDRWLRAAGWRVLRLEAELVEREVEVAVERVREVHFSIRSRPDGSFRGARGMVTTHLPPPALAPSAASAVAARSSVGSASTNAETYCSGLEIMAITEVRIGSALMSALAPGGFALWIARVLDAG